MSTSHQLHLIVFFVDILSVDGDWKIGDWGTAKMDKPASQKGTLDRGTKDYCAPEASNSSIYGKFSDIYSYAVVFYEMLVGECPCEANTACRKGNPEWYKQPVFEHPVFGQALREFLEKLLAYDYEQRASAEEALLELDSIIELVEGM